MEEGEIIFLPVKVQEGHLSEEVKIMVNLSQTGLDVLPNKYHNFISWIVIPKRLSFIMHGLLNLYVPDCYKLCIGSYCITHIHIIFVSQEKTMNYKPQQLNCCQESTRLKLQYLSNSVPSLMRLLLCI